jgi:hypothetical protein
VVSLIFPQKMPGSKCFFFQTLTAIANSSSAPVVLAPLTVAQFALPGQAWGTWLKWLLG